MILIDSGPLYALIDQNDSNHKRALGVLKEWIARESFILTLPVLTETFLLLEARLGLYYARKFWKGLQHGSFEIVTLGYADIMGALDIDSRYAQAHFGFVDSVCFWTCEKYKIKRVFTLDRRHFSIYRPRFTSFLEIMPT